jgi:hypothetical protein
LAVRRHHFGWTSKTTNIWMDDEDLNDGLEA